MHGESPVFNVDLLLDRLAAPGLLEGRLEKIQLSITGQLGKLSIHSVLLLHCTIKSKAPKAATLFECEELQALLLALADVFLNK